MKSVFIGPLLHWVLLAVLVVAGWLGGRGRLHVSEFNPFVITLIVATIAVLVIVLRSSSPGRRVTRDPVTEGDEEDA